MAESDEARKPWYKSIWAFVLICAGALAAVAGFITNSRTIYREIRPERPAAGLSLVVSNRSTALLARGRRADWSIVLEVRKNNPAALAGCKATITWPTQDEGGEAQSQVFAIPSGVEQRSITVKFRAPNELEGETGQVSVECNGDVESPTVAFTFPEIRT